MKYPNNRLQNVKEILLLLLCSQVSDSGVCAVTSMPDAQLAVACTDYSVSVWNLELNSEKCIVGYCLLNSKLS